MLELNEQEVMAVSGCGVFYALGKFIAEVANANDAIYSQYGNTNHNR